MKKHIFLAILFSFLFLFGCSKKVEFTRTGEPVCPYCKIKVEPHTEYCESCKHNFRYANALERCYACNGTKLCSSCKGSGRVYNVEGSREKCKFCDGNGFCSRCDNGAYVEFGDSPIKSYVHRE